MADISKIQIENTVYDVKDTYSRTNISSINTNLSIMNSEQTILIGDSYSLDRRPSIDISGWMKKLQELLELSDANCYKIQDNGGGFTKVGSLGTFETALTNLSVTDASLIKNIIVCGGLNDIDATKSTIKTAIHSFMTYCNTNYPNAKVYIGMIGWNIDSDGDAQYKRYQVIERVLPAYQECCDWGATYLNGVENVMHDYSEYYDAAHPNQTACDRLGYYIYQAFKCGYASVTYDDHYLTFTNANISTSYYSVVEKIVNNETIIFDNNQYGSQIGFTSSQPTLANYELYIGTLNSKYFTTVYTNSNIVTCNCVLKDTNNNYYQGTGTLFIRSYANCYLRFTGDSNADGKTIAEVNLLTPYSSKPTIMQ